MHHNVTRRLKTSPRESSSLGEWFSFLYIAAASVAVVVLSVSVAVVLMR